MEERNINEKAVWDVLQMASEVVGSRTLFVGIFDEQFSVMKAFNKEGGSLVEDGLKLPLELAVCNLVTCDEPLVIPNTKRDVRTSNLAIIDGARVGSYLGTPIVLEDGRMFGTLCAVDPDPYQFSESEIQGLNRLAGILSHIIYKNQAAVLPKIEEKILQLDKLALVGQLAAGLAHEIRNPMQSVRGFIQFLFNENEQAEPFQKIVLDELDRMNELINNFLLVTQPTAPKKEIVSIVEVIHDTVAFLKSEAALYNVEMNVRIEGAIPLVSIDPAQMRQVFMNLLKNAIEAMEKKKRGELNLIIKEWEGWALIDIQDTGSGIPLSIINKVGNPFFSTKDGTGMGLGLSICKTIINEHNGKLAIESDENGTVVTVKLPLTL
ncbi:ATP-binding protein [Priestia megaterium]|uniref:ATP-binding protein n=1 Tax=Priestia megaterium TaxID=1404 RepID=UPI002E251A34|nr:ATP-binding protein [Priestia megaterium]